MTQKVLYRDQYCEKHDQYYGKHLHRCPICWGEEKGKEPHIRMRIELDKDKK